MGLSVGHCCHNVDVPAAADADSQNVDVWLIIVLRGVNIYSFYSGRPAK